PAGGANPTPGAWRLPGPTLGDKAQGPGRKAAPPAAKPDAIVVAPDVKAAAPDAKAAAPDAKATPPLVPSGVLGPMQQFEKLVAGQKPAPAALEAFARYMATTGGDSRPEHRARDLARRAAEAEPTVKRLVFAGQLAGGKNQKP